MRSCYCLVLLAAVSILADQSANLLSLTTIWMRGELTCWSRYVTTIVCNHPNLVSDHDEQACIFRADIWVKTGISRKAATYPGRYEIRLSSERFRLERQFHCFSCLTHIVTVLGCVESDTEDPLSGSLGGSRISAVPTQLLPSSTLARINLCRVGAHLILGNCRR